MGFSIATNLERAHFHVYFIYLTHLNLCATMIVTWLGAILGTLHHIDKLKVENEMSKALKFYWLLSNQSIVFACLISMFYWSITHELCEMNLNNIFIHITNSAVLIVDLFIVRHPHNHLNFIFLIPVEVLYLIFTVIYQRLGGLDK